MDLSIIIPVYNGERYLKKCLDSIFIEIEDRTNVEVIIIDDGSTDNSSKIYGSYSHSNLRIIKNSNNGVSYSRNLGIQKATGNQIMFVDCDDYLSKGWYKKIMLLKSESDIIYFYTNKVILKTKIEVAKSIVNFIPNSTYMSMPCSKLYKRKMIIENNILFNNKIINGEDMIFNLQCLSVCNTYECIYDNIYSFRVNPNSSTKRFDEKLLNSDIEFYKVLEQYLYSLNINEKDINDIINYSKTNGQILFALKLFYSYNLKQFCNRAHILYDTPYNQFKTYKLDFFKNLMVFLINKKMLIMTYFIFNIKQKIKKVRKKEEYIIKI